MGVRLLSQPRQRILARRDEPDAVDAREHALVAQPLYGVGRALAPVLGAGLHDVTDLAEDVEQERLFEGGQPVAPGAQVEAGEAAEVEGVELQAHLVARERRDED